MTATPSLPLAFTLRAEGARMEYAGSHAKGLSVLFTALPDALSRRKIIDELEKTHAKMLAMEGDS